MDQTRNTSSAVKALARIADRHRSGVWICRHLPWLFASTSCLAADTAPGTSFLAWCLAALATGFALIAEGVWLRLKCKDKELQDGIAERKRLQAELELFRTAVEHSPVSTLITGSDTLIRYVSPSLVQTTGFDPAELIGKTPAVFQSGITPDSTYARLWRTLHKGQTWTGELQNRRKDGDLIWESTRIVPVKAADGSMQAYVGLKLDLTAPKAAEDRLAENEQKFGAILENLPCVVYQVQMNVTDRSLHFHYINGRVDMYGLSAEDVLRNPQILIERTHPEDRERLVANALDVERRMEPSRSVFRVHRTDGKLIWVVNHNIPSQLPDGSILWTGYSTDITAQREAEEQLRASEEKFRTLVETANDIIYTLDSSGRVDYVSPNWTTILGHPVGAIIGRDFDELLHPDDLASARAFLHGIVTAGRKQASAEYRVRHLDGTWIWHTANGAPLHDAERKTVGMFGIARDISERKQSEARILHMAHYDALTDLPNRSLIFDRLEQALQLAARRQHKLALMFVDLDRFKLINDTHGHAVGDRVLQQAAQRMSDALRGSDAVGRIGGDEFVVLLSEIDDVHTALDVAAKISKAISAPMNVDDLELLITCSIGVAVYPDHGKDAPELFRHADLAMYRGKEGGRATIRLHGHNASKEPVTLRAIPTAV